MMLTAVYSQGGDEPQDVPNQKLFELYASFVFPARQIATPQLVVVHMVYPEIQLLLCSSTLGAQ